eukprot:2342194-Pyramimonas_sp.AAC.1
MSGAVDSKRKYLRGESNSPVVEWLKMSLMSVSSPSELIVVRTPSAVGLDSARDVRNKESTGELNSSVVKWLTTSLMRAHRDDRVVGGVEEPHRRARG